MGGLKSEVDLLYNAILNGPAVQLTRYPTGAQGVLLTAGGVAWTLAAAGAGQVQVVAAGLNTTGMWICGAGIYAPSAAASFVLWIGRGTIPAAVRVAETEITYQIVVVTAVGTYGLIHSTQQLPLLFVRAGVGIALDITSSNAAADTARGHVVVATGLGA